ncbi:hypothetical protein P7C70_g3357, partial [Phenoliferia sp. Uapishka_3]
PVPIAAPVYELPPKPVYEAPKAEEFAVPPVPIASTSKGFSVKLSSSVGRSISPVVPASSTFSAPSPAAEPAKSSGFKLTFGGSAKTSAPPPQPPVISKVKKIKVAKSATFSDSVSYAEPTPPPSVGSSAQDDDYGYGSSTPAVKVKKHKDKDRERDRDKDKDRKKDKGKSKEKHPAPAPAPAVAAAAYLDPGLEAVVQYPGRPAELDLPLPPPPHTFISARDRIDVKKAKSVINKMKGMREAFFFLVPVDPVGLVANYYHEILHPMDLQTMTKKLDLAHGAYETYGELFDDFDLIVANCKQFNPPNTEPVWYVDVLDRAWRLEWEKASKLSYNLKRSLIAFMKKAMEDGSAFPFLESINTVIDQVPDYYDWIQKGDERDLGTIKKWLERDRYTSIEALEADVELMIKNCCTYNPPGTPVHESGKEFLHLFKQGISKIRADGKGTKRAGEKSGGGASKKQKY